MMLITMQYLIYLLMKNFIKPKQNKNSFIKFIFALILLLFFSTHSHAYFDPGTGSFIIQIILALGATVVFYLGYPLRLFKSVIKKLKKSTIKSKLNSE